MKSTKDLLERLKMKKGFNLISIPGISLTEEEADRFIDYMVDESAMKQYARVVRMKLPQKNIRAVGFGSGRFLYPSDEFNESKYKKQWAQNKIQLQTIKARGCLAIYDDDLEDIRGVTSEAAWKNGLMKIIAKKMANELEEVAYMGNTGTSPNSFAADDLRGQLMGWRYQINNSALSTDTYYNAAVPGGAKIMNACEGGESGNEFDLAGKIAERDTSAPYEWEFKYMKMIKNMPSLYKANNGLKNMVFLNNDLVTMDYVTALQSRATTMGDAAFKDGSPFSYFSVPIADIPLMPTNLGTATTYGTLGGGSYTDAILTPKNNLIIGIQRDIKLETQRVAADEATYLYYSIRFDVKIENTNAVVFVRCLTHAC